MAKKSRRGSNVGQGAQYWFRRVLADVRRSHELVGSARTLAPVSSFSSLISLLKQSPNIRRVVFNPEYPKQYSQLQVTRPLQFVDLHREFRWAGAYLGYHADKLARFVEFSTKFERALLRRLTVMPV